MCNDFQNHSHHKNIKSRLRSHESELHQGNVSPALLTICLLMIVFYCENIKYILGE